MIEQIGIAVAGVTAITLSQSTDPDHRRWAPIVGLIGQPFWFYAAIASQQWGVFIVCCLYTGAWASGIYNHWVRR